jgi:hypothetical protein
MSIQRQAPHPRVIRWTTSMGTCRGNEHAIAAIKQQNTMVMYDNTAVTIQKVKLYEQRIDVHALPEATSLVDRVLSAWANSYTEQYKWADSHALVVESALFTDWVNYQHVCKVFAYLYPVDATFWELKFG